MAGDVDERDGERIARVETKIEGIESKQSEIQRDVKEIHTAVNSITKEISNSHYIVKDTLRVSKEMNQAYINHDERINSIEDFQKKQKWVALGGASVAGAFVSAGIMCIRYWKDIKTFFIGEVL